MLIKVNMFIEVKGIDYTKRGEVAEKIQNSSLLTNAVKSAVHAHTFDSEINVDVKAIAIGNR